VARPALSKAVSWGEKKRGPVVLKGQAKRSPKPLRPVQVEPHLEAHSEQRQLGGTVELPGPEVDPSCPPPPSQEQTEQADVESLGNDVVFPDCYPATGAKLESLGLRVHPVDCSELAKAKGGVNSRGLLLTSD
jgi:hypothetical protein